MLARHGDPKRFEILSLIASILKLNDEEKAKVGLIRQVGAIVSPRGSTVSPTTGENLNFMSQFVTFLDSEARQSTEDLVPEATEKEASWFG